MSRERYTDLIDDLQRHLFPHQESDGETFTPEGRKRVDDWLHVLSRRDPFFPARKAKP